MGKKRSVVYKILKNRINNYKKGTTALTFDHLDTGKKWFTSLQLQIR